MAEFLSEKPKLASDARTAQRTARWALQFILAVTLFRLIMLPLSHLGLHGDEAQYWAWSQDLDFGYYSKPPMIAWVIAATTSIFGQSEWAIRLGGPIIHAGTAWLIYLTTRRLFGSRATLWACALFLIMPGVSLAATVISTDTPLLFFYALALFAWARGRERADWTSAMLLGHAIGLGLMSKYAMIYILPGLILAAIFESKTRAAFLNRKGVLAGLIALLVLLPNLIWNARNDFVTVAHTSDNANLSNGINLYPGELAEFLSGQLGVFGPISFVLLIYVLWRSVRQRRSIGLWLAILIATPLIVISAQALISRANANWAASAYVAAPILLASWAVTGGRTKRLWLGAGLALHGLLMVVPAIILTSPSLTDASGFANSVKRQRGWPETVAVIRTEADGFDTIAVDNRLAFYDLTYYGLPDTHKLRMWRFEPGVANHAELTAALPVGHERALIVSYYDDYESYFRDDFDRVAFIKTIEIPLGGGKMRRFRLYDASGYNGARPRQR